MFDAKIHKRKKSKIIFEIKCKNEVDKKNFFLIFEKKPKNPNNSPTTCQDKVGNIIAHYYNFSARSSTIYHAI